MCPFTIDWSHLIGPANIRAVGVGVSDILIVGVLVINIPVADGVKLLISVGTKVVDAEVGLSLSKSEHPDKSNIKMLMQKNTKVWCLLIFIHLLANLPNAQN